MSPYRTSAILEELTDYDKVGTWKEVREYLEATPSFTPKSIQPICYDGDEGKLFAVKLVKP
ncbi:MAG: hypothetical protein R6U44_06495 [Archaeoglobaceae archaeon]